MTIDRQYSPKSARNRLLGARCSTLHHTKHERGIPDENLQNENELLVEDKNSLVDILAQTTNELWMERNKPLPKDSLVYKNFKHGLSASYGVLIGSKPIYQLTYEKPLTPAMSLTGGVIWNGRPGVAGGIKIMF